MSYVLMLFRPSISPLLNQRTTSEHKDSCVLSVAAIGRPLAAKEEEEEEEEEEEAEEEA